MSFDVAAVRRQFPILSEIIDGRPVDLSNKHQRLYEKYRGRPKPAAR